MFRLAKSTIRKLFRVLGYDIIDHRLPTEAESNQFPRDYSESDISTIKFVAPYTMTGPNRILHMIRATSYIAKNRIPGAIVECGVWRGGSMMAAARTLLDHDITDRELYLYDTFTGMTEPTEVDVRCTGEHALDRFRERQTGEDQSDWCHASLHDVQQAMQLTSYDQQNIHYVSGKVEQTIPGTMPSTIAILRLDTDWYDSTCHELTHLFPRLVKGGVLIIDDYLAWKGQNKAVDEYIQKHQLKLFLHRIDESARMAIKV